jgi:hypothetical protein
LWLFNLYNYTAVAYPTRIRATAFAWTDGLGHLGAWGGVTLLGPLYAWGPNRLGWFLWLLIPGSLIPAIVIRTFGVKQSGVVLEEVSTPKSRKLPTCLPWKASAGSGMVRNGEHAPSVSANCHAAGAALRVGGPRIACPIVALIHNQNPFQLWSC